MKRYSLYDRHGALMGEAQIPDGQAVIIPYTRTGIVVSFSIDDGPQVTLPQAQDAKPGGALKLEIGPQHKVASSPLEFWESVAANAKLTMPSIEPATLMVEIPGLCAIHYGVILATVEALKADQKPAT